MRNADSILKLTFMVATVIMHRDQLVNNFEPKQWRLYR